MFGIENPWLLLAFWAGVAAAVASAGLMGGVYVLRQHREVDRRREAAFIEQWQRLFQARSLPDALPALDEADGFRFLRLWTHAFETAAPDRKAPLRALARRVHADRLARRLLHEPAHRPRLAAILALGYMQAEEARPRLESLARSGGPHLAPTAMLSLLRMDASRATPVLTQALCARFLWNGHATARVLEEAGPDTVRTILRRAVEERAPHEVVFLLRNLLRAEHDGARLLVSRVAERTEQDQTVVRHLAKGELRSSRQLALVEKYLAESTQRLRLLEALAEAKSTRERLESLRTFLESPFPWVREQARRAFPGAAPTLLRGPSTPQHENAS